MANNAALGFFIIVLEIRPDSEIGFRASKLKAISLILIQICGPNFLFLKLRIYLLWKRVMYKEALITQARVVGALILRETRVRYGRSQLGYLWAFTSPIMYVVPSP